MKGLLYHFIITVSKEKMNSIFTFVSLKLRSTSGYSVSVVQIQVQVKMGT